MSKIIADRVYTMTDEAGDMVVCFSCSGGNKTAAKMTAAELKGQKVLLDAKVFRNKRSLNQNRMLWALLEKMAEAMSGYKRKTSVDECYCLMLEETGAQSDFLLALPEAEQSLRSVYRVIRKIGEREVNGKELNMYQVFAGSSKFNTEEMNRLIDATLDRLAELGVQDSEILTIKNQFLYEEGEQNKCH